MAFASLYDSTVPATFRVVVDGDIVPGVCVVDGREGCLRLAKVCARIGADRVDDKPRELHRNAQDAGLPTLRR